MPLVNSKIVHPNWLNLPYAFNSLCTVQQPTATQRPDGELIKTFTNVEGLMALRCALAVDSFQHQEKRGEDYTTETITHHVTIAGYYPQIKVNYRLKTWRNDGGLNHSTSELVSTFNIISVEHDSKNIMTRIMLEYLNE